MEGTTGVPGISGAAGRLPARAAMTASGAQRGEAEAVADLGATIEEGAQATSEEAMQEPITEAATSESGMSEKCLRTSITLNCSREDGYSCRTFLTTLSGSILRTTCGRLAMWFGQTSSRMHAETHVELGTYKFIVSDAERAFVRAIGWFEMSGCSWDFEFRI